MLLDQIAVEENRDKYDINLETILDYIDSFVTDFEYEEVRKRILDLFIDKIYIDNEKMISTFHYLDDKQELSYEDAISMIDNNAIIFSYMGEYSSADGMEFELNTMKRSIVGGGESTDFFQ